MLPMGRCITLINLYWILNFNQGSKPNPKSIIVIKSMHLPGPNFVAMTQPCGWWAASAMFNGWVRLSIFQILLCMLAFWYRRICNLNFNYFGHSCLYDSDLTTLQEALSAWVHSTGPFWFLLNQSLLIFLHQLNAVPFSNLVVLQISRNLP